MNQVIHQNYFSPDSDRIFCKKLHKVTEPDYDTCSNCEYCFGSLQGMGVECIWPDNVELPIVSPETPESELLRVSALIDSGVLKKG